MSTTDKRPLKVFLCHAHSDAAAVRVLYSRLKREGVDAWLDKEKLLPGQDWELEIRKAVRESDVVVVCLSKQFNLAGFRQREVRLALDTAMEKPEGEIFIIPLRLEECDSLESLSRWHWVDLFEDDGYERLVRALRVQADKIYVTLKTRRKRSQPEKENLLAGPTKKEILEDEPSKPKVKKTKALRKPNTAIIVALIGFVGTILAALLGSPALVAWMQPTRIPTETPIASRTLVSIPIAAFTGSSPSATLPPDLTPTDTLTPTVTSMPTEITDVKGVSMMLVSSGEFTMGNNASIDARPAHTLYFDAYYMDKYEVTNVLYATCVNVNACKRPKDIHYYDDPDYAEHPVVFVDWYMAKDYCAWRGARLPTEAEWEKAARGPEGKKYPWGETIDCSYANYRGENAHCVGKSTPVGSYESGKSAYGIYDLAGNVTEWVSSLYAPYPYMSNDGRENPNSNGDRVLRGGSWNSTDPFVLSTDRTWTTPSQAEFDQGFRCARDVDS